MRNQRIRLTFFSGTESPSSPLPSYAALVDCRLVLYHSEDAEVHVFHHNLFLDAGSLPDERPHHGSNRILIPRLLGARCWNDLDLHRGGVTKKLSTIWYIARNRT